MKQTRRFHRLAAAFCVLVLLLNLLPAAYAADTELTFPLNPDFGTYLGLNKDGIHEFEITVPADEGDVTRHNPLLPQNTYRKNREIVAQSPSGVIEFNATGFRGGMKSGTATVEYYVAPTKGPGSNEPLKLYIIVYVTVVPKSSFDPSVNKGFANVQPTAESQMYHSSGDTATPPSSTATPSTTPGTTTAPSPSPTPSKPVKLPTAATSTQEYQIAEIIGGSSGCQHSFDSSVQGRIHVSPSCTGYGYVFWPCRNCGAYEVGAVLYPTQHSFNINGVCTKCGVGNTSSKPSTTPSATPSTTPSSSSIRRT